MSGFYKMDPAKWDFGTAELSLEEEAAYLRIVNAIHKHDDGVPNNDRVLAGMFRVSTRKARALLDALLRAGKVVLDGGKIWNERARSDMVHRQFVTISHQVRGSKGGRTRAENAAKSLENNNADQAPACPRIEENRIEYNPHTPKGIPFEDFWTSWPNKTGKAAAEKAWKKLGPQDRETAAGSARGWFEAWRRKHPDASPIHPASFLNGRRWEDEGDKPQTGGDRHAGAVHSIKSGKAFLCGGISASLARELIQLGRVTEAECREVRVI